MEKKIYDLVIIGAGPAGLSASVYASRYKIDHLVLGEILGGQISETHKIDNYLAVEDVSGFDFSQKIGNHAKKYGVEIRPLRVENVLSFEKGFVLKTTNREEIKTKTLLLATGTKKRKLGALNEEKFLGKGISYCATCDGFFYRNKIVAVVGGSDSAVGAASYLGELAKKVYLIYRKSELRAEPYWVDQVKNNPKIEVIFETNVIEAQGIEKIEKIVLDKKFQGEKIITLDGLFVEIGSDIALDYLDKKIEIQKDTEGYIVVSSDGKTSVPGIWAAGDITTGSDKFRQVITAASEGAISARSIFKHLKSLNESA